MTASILQWITWVQLTGHDGGTLQIVEPSSNAADQLAILLDAPNAPLDHTLLLFSECLQQLEGVAARGLWKLDDLADEVRASTEPDTADGRSERGHAAFDVSMLVNGLFGSAGFAGDIENYHAEENSFLDQVLERRVGMPITLSALVVTIGERLGMDLSLIGLPGHVVVGVSGEDDTFVDAFSGSIVDRAGLVHRLRSIFGVDTDLTEDQLVPMSTTAVITRVSNNLMRTWADDSSKFDRLLELRAVLPLERADQRMLIGIAEARARFDIAAKVREALDPEDPKIEQNWGRLN